VRGRAYTRIAAEELDGEGRRALNSASVPKRRGGTTSTRRAARMRCRLRKRLENRLGIAADKRFPNVLATSLRERIAHLPMKRIPGWLNDE
jgi:hypothetical protein